MTASGRTPIYGPEPWTTKRGAAWSYWDLWFCVVALADHDGDLDALGEAIENGGRTFGSGTVESKLSHLDDLKRRMAQAGIDARALASEEDADPRTRAKARTKVLKQGLYPRDMTEPMWHTPRQRLYEGRCGSAGSGSRSRPSRSMSGCRTGSARDTDRKVRRSGSPGGSKPR
jgi:hypothetical protein